MAIDTQIVAIIQILQDDRNKAAAQQLLRSKGLAFSGLWEVIERRISESISNGTIPADEWIDLIDAEEESGYQHVFLFRCRDGYRGALEQTLRDSVSQAGLDALWNRTLVLHLPDEPTLASVKKRRRHAEAEVG